MCEQLYQIDESSWFIFCTYIKEKNLRLGSNFHTTALKLCALLWGCAPRKKLMESAQTLRYNFARNENEHKARGGALFNFFC